MPRSTSLAAKSRFRRPRLYLRPSRSPAHIWSSYALYSDGKQVARGINSIQAVKEAGGWRVAGIMVQAESATAPLPRNICRKGGPTVIVAAKDKAAVDRGWLDLVGLKRTLR